MMTSQECCLHCHRPLADYWTSARPVNPIDYTPPPFEPFDPDPLEEIDRLNANNPPYRGSVFFHIARVQCEHEHATREEAEACAREMAKRYQLSQGAQ